MSAFASLNCFIWRFGFYSSSSERSLLDKILMDTLWSVLIARSAVITMPAFQTQQQHTMQVGLVTVGL